MEGAQRLAIVRDHHDQVEEKTKCQKALLNPDGKFVFYSDVIVSICGILVLFFETYWVFLREDQFIWTIIFLPVFIFDMYKKATTMYTVN